jgi:hypothetical protein
VRRINNLRVSLPLNTNLESAYPAGKEIKRVSTRVIMLIKILLIKEAITP